LFIVGISIESKAKRSYEAEGVFLVVDDSDMMAEEMGETLLDDLEDSLWASRSMRM
jgi:hypothetical protein